MEPIREERTMRAVCLANVLTPEQENALGLSGIGSDANYGELVLGEEYLVYGLRVLHAQPWIDVLSDFGYLYPVPLVLFRITDPVVSKYWVIEESDAFVLRPAQFSDPFFYDDLSNGRADAVSLFNAVREMMEGEHRPVTFED
jgi:hypothetical protein